MQDLGTYERLLEEPKTVLNQVFGWVGQGDVAKAYAVIEPKLARSQAREPVPAEDIEPRLAQLFDDFHAAIHSTSSVPQTLIGPLNAAFTELSERYARPDSRRVADASLEEPDELR